MKDRSGMTKEEDDRVQPSLHDKEKPAGGDLSKDLLDRPTPADHH